MFSLAFLPVNPTTGYAQRFEDFNLAVKTNILSTAATGSLNVAVELAVYKSIYRMGNVVTLNLPLSYNPFTFKDNKKLKHIAFQPEVRLWNPMAFEGFFLGANVLYAYYNAGGTGLPFKIAPALKERRYQGQLYGGGVSAGYYFTLGDRFSLETSLGVGYAYMDQEVYYCETCGTKIKDETRAYVGPTRAAVSLVYIIR